MNINTDPKPAPVVYEYTNYRLFLKDFHAGKKAANAGYSYQSFALKAGFKSKASLANITSGRQSLSMSKIFEVARAMSLGKKETEYFDSLVHFNEAKTIQEREYHFERMRNLAQRSPAARLMDSQYDYYSKWYHCAIRELVTIVDFNNNFALLGTMVEPPITPAQAKKSVALLKHLGMITESSTGRYCQTETLLSTGDEVKSLALQKYHQAHLHLASESINRHTRYQRDISSITAGVSRQGFKQIKFEIQQFRKRLLEIIGKDMPAAAVYQIAFQTYPLSKLPKEWGHD
jgi:uncharacterized protein (TIGR02147 family)